MEILVDGPGYSEKNIEEKVTYILAGSKILTLVIIPSLNRASVEINTRPDMPHIDGETTAVFTKAKELLSAEADKIGPIFFHIETSWRKLKAWVETTGKELFGWEILPRPDDPEGVRAEVYIKAQI